MAVEMYSTLACRTRIGARSERTFSTLESGLVQKVAHHACRQGQAGIVQRGRGNRVIATSVADNETASRSLPTSGPTSPPPRTRRGARGAEWPPHGRHRERGPEALYVGSRFYRTCNTSYIPSRTISQNASNACVHRFTRAGDYHKARESPVLLCSVPVRPLTTLRPA